jgi:thiamine biosynthesis lipoprotein
VVGLPAAAAGDAIEAAFAELELIEQVMSLYRPTSQVCQLNRTGEVRQPHPYLALVLQAAESAARQSAGAFDITVQPLWDLYSTAHKQSRLPNDEEVAAARAMVDWQRVEVSPDHIRLRKPVTAITLNGIAQGFAADRARAVLQSHGVRQALINTGEMGSIGRKSAAEPWKVGIQHPREADAYVSLAGLEGRSLATSGDYETSFSPDFRKNHIFDPRTGDSPQQLASVSIVAPTAMQADALSTAAMVLGGRDTLELVSRLPDVDALLVWKDGRTLATPGFPAIDPA